MDVKASIYHALDAMGIPYEKTAHPPAGTMADLVAVERRMDCVIPKNLFLTPRNRSAFYLCLTTPDAVFRTADVSKQVGASRLSFGDPDTLHRLLRTQPGAISPMGLLFDEAHAIHLLVDRDLPGEARLGFHPNDNTETLVMASRDFFETFLRATNHEPTLVTCEKG